MFNTIKGKILACLSLIVVALGIALKFVMGRNKELKREVKIKDKQSKIRKEQDEIKEEVIEDEYDRIEEAKSNSTGSRSERLNRVLNNRDNS